MSASTERDRLKVKAGNMARTELVARHRDEYSFLYQFYCDHLGVGGPPLGRHTERPPAPEYQA